MKKAMTLDMTWEHREKLIRREEYAEGEAEGQTAERTRIFTKMFAKGHSIAEIAELTGYSKSEIEEALNLVKN